MARRSRRRHALGVVFLIVGLTEAQSLTNLPTLTTNTGSAATSTGGGPTSSGTASSSATFATTGGTTTVSHLTGLPTIGGVGIPKLVIPYTADAPFMRKSSLPEGTFFIAVGATLAFLGACVLLWRMIVAWSVELSVKRSAKMSMAAYSEKSGHGAWGGSRKSSGYNAVSKSPFYKSGDGNSVSMEALTAAGKQVKHQYRDSMTERSNAPPENLFFSPTAQPREGGVAQQRMSGYMPSGFYASPSSQPGGGGANAAQARNHARSGTQGTQVSWSSPPVSPAPPSRGSTALRGVSREGPLHSRDGSRAAAAPARESYAAGASNDSPRRSQFYANPSNSSLEVGQSSMGSESGPPSRAPSAYLEDMFDNHGRGPNESRFR